MTVWALALICLLGAPVLLALVYRKVKKGHVLQIRQDYKRDVRYFGHSFANMMEKAIPDMKDGKIYLSKEEDIIEVGKECEFHTQDIAQIVLAKEEDFKPKENNLNFKKEIYCGKDAYLTADQLKIRALYSKKRIIVGNGTKIIRWLDGEEVVIVNNHCDMGVSTTSGEQLLLGFDNTFHRLFAPIVRIGWSVNEIDDKMQWDDQIFRLPIKDDVKNNIRYVNEDMALENGIVPYSVFSKHDVDIAEEIVLQGSIHSEGVVRIMKNSIVVGNVFAEEGILLKSNATILGNVFTQGDITFEEGASVGQPQKIRSVIARNKIRFYGKNTVFGFVSAGAGGDVFMDLDSKEDAVINRFPEKQKQIKHLVFQNVEDYKNVDLQGFRLDSSTGSVKIPDGANLIPKSQFFGCSELKKVYIPDSITSIEDYAFADCPQMVLLKNLGESRLARVGISAFENCESIELQEFPKTLQVMEGAAFANCFSLKKAVFSKDALLKKIGDHGFRGCRNLEEVYLPDYVEYVGVSAFRECDSLKRISVPETVKDQMGIVEILENHPNIIVEFRKIENTSVDKEGENYE